MEVYKTIKRSFSATANGIIGGVSPRSVLSSPASSKGSLGGWIHPPACLINARVEYVVKMLGQTEVPAPRGTKIVEDAIHAIRFHLQIERGKTGHSGAKQRKVVLQISVNCVNVLDAKSRAIIVKHHLSRISFCADDRQDKRLFSYIAKNEQGKYQCFVFLSDKMAENITLTVGEAFDLAYEKQVKKRGKELANQKHELLLRKKIAELEEENRQLKHRLEGCTCAANCGPIFNKLVTAESSVSSYPLNFSNEMNARRSNSPPVPPLPLAPPPRRANNQHGNLCCNNHNDILVDIFGQNNAHVLPAVNANEIFDDEFDPRADEKKMGQNGGQNDNGEAMPHNQQNTVEQFEALLRRVDKQLADVQNNLDEWNLERGETGDSGRDWSIIEDEEQQKECEEERERNGCPR
ncbi:hypothetical protein niasHT_030670 [Heterodera trifolii]|uniref:PID domain-containing protein n=1 Tax=Heterodera trifolii TaxID=157864 RepID=A0ABD2HNU3_9BILA